MELTLEQDRFCRLYTQNDELFGNGTLAYAEAYDYRLEELSHEDEKDSENKPIHRSSPYSKSYDICSASASRLLRNEKIQAKVTDCLNELLKDTIVDSQLVKVIMQDSKLESKVAAIKEYNQLKGRIIKKTDLTSLGEKIIVMPQELINKNVTNTIPESNSTGSPQI